MKKLILLAMLSLLSASCSKNPNGGTGGDEPQPVTDFYAKGADISWVTEMESKGYKFYNAENKEMECTALMKELGFNSIRLRVWVNPADGWCGKADLLKKAQRAQKLGMKIMIDFHYSDSWADPGKQPVPAAWASFNAETMAAAVASHTKDVLTSLKNAGIDVKWVQVGNEVTNGMLWGVADASGNFTEGPASGRVQGQNAANFVKYFTAGYEAVKEVYPKAEVVLHVDNGWNSSTLNWFFGLMESSHLKYDIIGLSLYPSYWTNGSYPNWMTKTRQCVSNINMLLGQYGKPVMICEFGMPASEPANSAAALKYLLDSTSDIENFLGIFLWEPESEKSRNGYDYGAFEGGKATAALAPMAEIN